MPKRVQRKRVKGWTKPDGCVYVGRGSKWGNPYVVGGVYPSMTGTMNPITLDESLYRYEVYVNSHIKLGYLNLSELKGKDLMCWCSLSQKCHADILLELANKE